MENELDLQEQVRRDDVYIRINEIIDKVSNLGVFPSLVWVWAWDVVKDKLDSFDSEAGESYVVNPKFSEKDIWDMFWEDADKNGFSLEYGAEDLYEAVFDWMTDRDILIDNEGEEDEDE